MPAGGLQPWAGGRYVMGWWVRDGELLSCGLQLVWCVWWADVLEFVG